MKNLIKFETKIYGILMLTTLLLIGCETEKLESELNDKNTVETLEKQKGYIVDVYSDGLNFHIQDEIPTGWTTFNYDNRTSGTHFFLLQKLPEGKTVEDVSTEITAVFQKAMDFIYAGDFNSGFATFAEFPDWIAEIVYTGGVGFLASNQRGTTTQYLEPGRYVMECYVKNSNGQFHSSLGMIDEFIVTETESHFREPKSTVSIDISSAAGFQISEGKLRPGKNIIAVNFLDQSFYSNGLGHDLHIAHLDEDADISDLNEWMNYIFPGELEGGTLPKGVTFLGGIQDMPAGNTAYIDVLLKPGKYVLIAEIPDPMSEGMLVTFDVPD